MYPRGPRLRLAVRAAHPARPLRQAPTLRPVRVRQRSHPPCKGQSLARAGPGANVYGQPPRHGRKRSVSRARCPPHGARRFPHGHPYPRTNPCVADRSPRAYRKGPDPLSQMRQSFAAQTALARPWATASPSSVPFAANICLAAHLIRVAHSATGAHLRPRFASKRSGGRCNADFCPRHPSPRPSHPNPTLRGSANLCAPAPDAGPASLFANFVPRLRPTRRSARPEL